jgi:hypothetical protein
MRADWIAAVTSRENSFIQPASCPSEKSLSDKTPNFHDPARNPLWNIRHDVARLEVLWKDSRNGACLPIEQTHKEIIFTIPSF